MTLNELKATDGCNEIYDALKPLLGKSVPEAFDDYWAAEYIAA